MTTAIAKVLEIARRKLLDTGTRNRLVHVNRYNQRANCLNVINERSGDIYKTLRLDGKRMRFKATGKDRTNSENEILLAMSDTKSSNLSSSVSLDSTSPLCLPIAKLISTFR